VQSTLRWQAIATHSLQLATIADLRARLRCRECGGRDELLIKPTLKS